MFRLRAATRIARKPHSGGSLAQANSPRHACSTGGLLHGGLHGWPRLRIFSAMMVKDRTAKFAIGEIVRHRIHPFRGVIFDVDPVFANTEEWYQSIPAEMRPRKDQPFYHLLAENAQSTYVAYVSEQNLLPDAANGPVKHPDVGNHFADIKDGRYMVKGRRARLN
jgi:heat shock protein HspQ